MQCNEQFTGYIKAVCGQIRWKKAHKKVANEIEDHLIDHMEALLASGLEEAAAVKGALEEMGDPIQVGKQFDAVYRPQKDKVLFACIIALMVIGVAIQLGMSLAIRSYANTFAEYAFFIPFGIAALAIAYFFDFSRLLKHSIVVYAVLFALEIAALFLMNNSRAITDFFMMQDSVGVMGNIILRISRGADAYIYFLFLLSIPVFAGVIHSQRMHGYKGLLLCLTLYFINVGLCFYSNDLAPVAHISIGYLVLLIVTICKDWFAVKKPRALLLVCMPILAMFVFVLTQTDQFFTGYDTIHNAVSKAKLFGPFVENLRGSSNYYMIMTDGHSDYLFSYIILQFGYIAGAVSVFALSIPVFRMFKSSCRPKSSIGFIISLASSLAVTSQMLLYVIRNIGIFGMRASFPLLGYGGVSYIVNMILIGIMLSSMRHDSVIAIDKYPSQSSQVRHLAD